MKKIGISLATLALSASASALPHFVETEHKTLCLSIYKNQHGATYLGGCDESKNNHERHARLNSEGCAEGQAALKAFRPKGDHRPFSPEISSCHAPNVAQL